MYIYKDGHGNIIYVGKAKNLRNRVHQYFQPPVRLGPKTAALVAQIKTIEYIEVFCEIEALLLEGKLIKKFKPKYNIAAKDDKSPYYIHVTNGKYPKPVVNHQSSDSLAGPFLNGYIARNILRQFRRVAPYCTSPTPQKPCFYTHLGLCDPDPIRYKQNISKLKKLLAGRFESVSRDIKSQMVKAAKEQNFEQAGVLRDKLKNLEYLLQTPVSADEFIVNPNLADDKRREALEHLSMLGKNLHRIEMFDIANLSGTFATGAMTVAIDGQVKSSEYRHFTIKYSSSANDVEMMREMLNRRLAKSDWPKPDLIVLDGGKPQLSVVSDQLTIPVFALAKQEEIIFARNGEQIKLERNNPGLQLLQLLRDEAHRFSRRLHHKHRNVTIK